MIEYNRAVYVPGIDIWLDAQRMKNFSFVSHAHTDHAIRHRRVLATPETLALLEHRRGKTEAMALRYNQPITLRTHRITLFPAGHILGSAQILIEAQKRLVYTGDFKLSVGVCAQPAEVKPCDILVMECTFGLPHYLFPPRAQTVERLVTFIEKAFSEGKTPVVLGYTLGKGQEALKIIGDAGYKVVVHESIYQVAKIYERLGVTFGDYQRYPGDGEEGKVVVAPTHLRRDRLWADLGQISTVYLSGWACDSGKQFALGVDLALPLSDHADFKELVEYIEMANPSKVYTVHGFPQFAHHLRALGLDAEHLPQRQLSLF